MSDLRLTAEQEACLTLERDLQEVGQLLSPAQQWKVTGSLHRLKRALGLDVRTVALVGRAGPIAEEVDLDECPACLGMRPPEEG